MCVCVCVWGGGGGGGVGRWEEGWEGGGGGGGNLAGGREERKKWEGNAFSWRGPGIFFSRKDRGKFQGVPPYVCRLLHM